MIKLKEVDLTEIEKIENEIKSLKLKILELENEQAKKIQEKQEEYFGHKFGFSYYYNDIDETIEKDNIKIIRCRDDIKGELKLDNGVLVCNSDIEHDMDIFRCYVKYESGKMTNSVPKKYEKEEKILIEEVRKYKVFNPFLGYTGLQRAKWNL